MSATLLPDPTPAVLAATLRRLFGPAVVVETATVQAGEGALFIEEQRHIARASAARRAEFGTARVCARRALAQLGMRPCPLVPHADRSPWWPPGVRGTIAHAAGVCAVAVTTAPGLRAIGLDVEADAPLPLDLEPLICTDAERDWLASTGDRRGRIGKLIFSAKEAWYKCQYGITGTLLDFREVTLAIDVDVGRFHAIEPSFLAIDGRFAYAAGLLATTASLSA